MYFYNKSFCNNVRLLNQSEILDLQTEPVEQGTHANKRVML